MNKIKMAAYLMASGIFLTGCKTDLSGIINRYKASASEKEFKPTVVITPTDETTENTKQTTEELEPTATAPLETEEIMEVVLPTEQVIYTNDDVPLFSGPTEESLVIGNLAINTQTTKILTSANGWELVRHEDCIGYIHQDDITYTDEAIQVEYNHYEKSDIVLTTSDLNFRVGPSTESERILTFPKNTELQVIATLDNEWLLVKHNGIIGYVHGNYTISLLEKANELYPELALSNLKVEKIVYSTTTLNVRCGNSQEFEQIGQLERYETVRVLGEYGDWYFVMSNNYDFGFINKNYTEELKDRFVIVDKSEQRLYLYEDNELYYVTPVTTGKDLTPSDTGSFKIYAKETQRYLVGEDYRAFVKYWMPYNGGEGLHDASWRSVFGTESYHYAGSHGCINLQPAIADDIYENVEIGTKVLVHK